MLQAGGFVLAGGKSTRMGRDKALLELDGETLVARAVRSLKGVCADVAISGGSEELARYGRVVPDLQTGCGPLGGIVSALEWTRFEWNVFLAVDVPFVPASAWSELLRRAEATKGIAVMARVQGQAQPLCAVYARRAVSALRDERDAGRFKVTAAAAAAGLVEFVDFDEGEWFRNCNTAEEFSRLRAGIRE